MKKLFTLLTMLVIGISVMWAADVTPVTALENGKYYLKMISSGSERIVYYDSSSSYLIWKNYINLNSDCQVFIFTQGTGTYAGRYTIQTSDGKYVTYTSVSDVDVVRILSGSDATDSNKWWVLGVDGSSYDIYPWRDGSIATDQPAWNMAVTRGSTANAAVGLYNGKDGNSKVTLKKMQKHMLASPEPSNGSFAANTIWYTISIKEGNYIYNQGDASNIALSRKTTSYGDDDLWCFVGDLSNGYKIYNKGAGTGKFLSASTTMSGSNGGGTYAIVQEEQQGNNTTWDFSIGNTINNRRGYFIGQHGNASNRMNQRDNKLAFWTTGADDGSTFVIKKVEEYNIIINGGGDNGRIIIDGTEYANGTKFFRIDDAEFTPVAKTITGYISGEIVFSGNTISVEYTGYNGIINGMTTISANAWTAEAKWDYLTDNWDSHGPGCPSSDMWSPIYLKDIKGGTVPALEGWNFRMIADHSNYTIESLVKIQGEQSCYFTLKNTSVVTINFGSGGHTYPLTVNLDEGTGNILTFNMSNGYNHACQTDCNGKITVNYGSVSKDTNRLFKAKNTSSKHVNTLILNAALTTPTEYNTLETITLATFDNVSCHTLTTNILDNEGWTESTNMNDLQHPSVAGKYYFVQKISSGVTLYTYMPKTYDVTGVETLSEIVDYKTYTIFNIPDGSTLILDEELEENQVINAEAITSVIQINDGITLNIDNITNTQFPTITGDGTLNINMSESEVRAKLNGNASCTLVDVLSDDQIAVGALKINDAEKYTIDDYDYYISQDESTKDIVLVKHYTRNVTSGNFGSICLPNGASVLQMTGVAKVLKVTEITTDRVVMDEVDEMVAGVPYIFKSNATTINLTLEGANVDEPTNDPEGYLVGNFETPVFVPISDNSNNYYILQSNQFKKVTSETIKSGKNRCYLKVSGESSRMSTLGIAVDEGGATGIDAINSLMNNDAEIYDLNGRRLNDLRKGINIVNGVKVIVK